MRWWNVIKHHSWLSCVRAWGVCGIQKLPFKIEEEDEEEVEKSACMKRANEAGVWNIKVKFDKYLHKSTLPHVQPWTIALGNTSFVSVALECTLRRMTQASSWFNAIDYFCRSFNRSFVHCITIFAIRLFFPHLLHRICSVVYLSRLCILKCSFI